MVYNITTVINKRHMQQTFVHVHRFCLLSPCFQLTNNLALTITIHCLIIFRLFHLKFSSLVSLIPPSNSIYFDAYFFVRFVQFLFTSISHEHVSVNILIFVVDGNSRREMCIDAYGCTLRTGQTTWFWKFVPFLCFMHPLLFNVTLICKLMLKL